MNQHRFWEGLTVVLLVFVGILVVLGAIEDDADLFRAATPVGAMSIATATLALYRKP